MQPGTGLFEIYQVYIKPELQSDDVTLGTVCFTDLILTVGPCWAHLQLKGTSCNEQLSSSNCTWPDNVTYRSCSQCQQTRDLKDQMEAIRHMVNPHMERTVLVWASNNKELCGSCCRRSVMMKWATHPQPVKAWPMKVYPCKRLRIRRSSVCLG